MLGTRSLVSLAVVTVALAACSRKPEPVTPTPTPAGPDRPTPPTTRDTTGDGARAQAAAAAAAAADRDRASAALRTELQEMVFFDYDVATIRDDAKAVLDRKVVILRNNPRVTLRVEGHADERGSVEYNLALSLRRANALRNYLANFQLDANRFEVVPLGEERPLSTGTSESDYARNRRGEFIIIAGGDDLRR
ncbi:MAG: OmpA family protein [Gemmatimonadota bacterium]